MAAGGKCTVKINASEGLARVIFAETSYLGIEPVPDQSSKIGDVITFESGKHNLIIYNGAPSGPITIMISFSGAANMVAGAVAVAAAWGTMF